ncbi:helix-turn-helix domain-containing protein [Haliscomenobacter hydrossis]|uniref:Transcriptional regulator, AraC family n=1 Tax=Haliscomenobacter hydrossis (strain ATCC 27775 / DSM 1100 / LMG 10767 / O) TaxID=760192 RepID=F4KPY6_HALH1|nr:AraC family transcriptional regulator [Haliscomenobacter hydrossis]AEE53190.1 transcriptional regulator, AraC family [Haliscomenobacter hydrossis DSM 1100]
MTVPTFLKIRSEQVCNTIPFNESKPHVLRKKDCFYCLQEHQIDWIKIDLSAFYAHSKGYYDQDLFIKFQEECCFFQSLRSTVVLNKVFEEFCGLILDQSNGRLQVQEYINDLKISHQHLNKLCEKQLGFTLHNIIVRRNLLIIKMELINGNRSVKDICVNLGYSEPTNFSKFFKKHTGFTPSSYRNAFNVSKDLLRSTPPNDN